MKRPNLNSAFTYLSLTLFISLLGCQTLGSNEKASATDKYSKFLSELGIEKRSSKCIVVPTHGCGPCIKAAMDFLRDSVSSSNIVIVISGPSQKSCSLLMKKFNVQRKDAIFDSKGRAKGKSIVTIYPVLLSYEDNNWQAVNITPDNHKDALKIP
jgi:hypothetical protein